MDDHLGTTVRERLVRSRLYFAVPFDPPAWRRGLVQIEARS